MCVVCVRVYDVGLCALYLWFCVKVVRTTYFPQTLGRLGLLALACSDGAVRVLSVPHALPLVEAIGEMSRTPPFPVWVESVQTQAKLLPGAFSQSKERDIFGPCISVDWSRKDGHDKMAASFASGKLNTCNAYSCISIHRSWHMLAGLSTLCMLEFLPYSHVRMYCMYVVV